MGKSVLAAVLLIIATTTATLGISTPAAAAVYDLTALSSPCADGSVEARNIDVAEGAPGRLHGFYSLTGSDSCGSRLFYVEGSDPTWSIIETPWQGQVRAVAHDSTGTYLLYSTPGLPAGLSVAKRNTDGAFVHLSTITQRAESGGGIAAYNGRWAAVWSAKPSRGAAAELYQTGPLLSSRSAAARITHDDLPDLEPTIARDAETGKLTIAWSRGDEGTLYIGRQTRATRWVMTATASVLATDIDLLVTGGTTFLTWTDGTDPRVMQADDVDGEVVTTQLPAGRGTNVAHHSRLQVSGGRLYVAYTMGAGGVLLLQRPVDDPTEQLVRALPPTMAGETVAAAAGVAVDGPVATVLAFRGAGLYAARVDASG